MVTHKYYSVTSEEVVLSSTDCPALMQLIESKKVHITPLRERVSYFVRQAKDKGISAYPILELMKKDNPNAKPSTVYRSLDYLEKTGIIVKIECCSKFVRKKHLSSETATLFMICATCGTIIQHVDQHIHSYIEK